MTFKPTEKNQKAWVKKHLNNGICPDTSLDYGLTIEDGIDVACWEALDWLSESSITTLEEVWDQCTDPTWMAWMYARMDPTKRDAILWIQTARKSIDMFSKSPEDKKDELEDWEGFGLTPLIKKSSLFNNQLREAIGQCGDWMEPYEGKVNIKNRSITICDFIREYIPNPWK